MDPRLEQIFSLLPHRCDSIFIAGGAAVDYDKAGDVDIIFGGKNGWQLGVKFIQSFAFHSKYEGPAYGGPNDLHLLGDALNDIDNKIIQVLWTKDKTAQEVIDKFDISKHALAYTSKGQRFACIDSQMFAIRKSYANYKTFSRYIKICNRYDHPVDPTILEQLSSKQVGKPKMEIPDWMAELLKPPVLGPKLATDPPKFPTYSEWAKYLNPKTPEIK